MQLADATVLITGANRGIGLAFARAALARGARRVYAAARDPASVKTTAEATRRQMEVNFFGMLRMAQGFAPVLGSTAAAPC
jgi:NAD(P)-dependent dehydrogenase (short-subunit alcohol dehydrogenase family)